MRLESRRCHSLHPVTNIWVVLCRQDHEVWMAKLEKKGLYKSLIEEFQLQCISSRVSLNHSYFNGMDLVPINEILKDKKIDPAILKNTLNRLASTHLNMKGILEEIVTPQDPLYKILAVRMAAYWSLD